MSDTRTQAAARLGALMREAASPATSQRHLEGRARLVASVERMQPSRMRPALFAFSFAAAVAVVAFVFLHRRAPHALAWHVDDGTVGTQGYVAIPAGAPSARLVFDDGSNVSLAPGSRSRVAGTTPSGAEVVLEQGRAHVHVQHREGTSWMIDAGPYAVHVTGTDFLVAWAADAETLDVWMQSGRVAVTGPVVGDAVTLSTGQHLVAKVRDRSVRIDVAPEPVEADPPAVASTIPDESPTPVPGGSVALPPTPAPMAPAPTWAKLVAAGDYARVVSEAERAGIAHDLRERPLPDLRALGDAARYAGRSDLAKRAYATIRARFPSTGEARTCAFLLGRVEEEQDHAASGALHWYDVYLTEAPGGAFAGDALGRKMVIVSTVQGRDAARPLALGYLQRFPAGPYAAAARDLAP